ncbi:MAG: PHP domain-containing protein [Ruminococcaceae bacterium]|nr:PHP domain-containing protein [Oscillospiraceae bacterium]
MESKRQYLLPKTGAFYKTNLHCHTNLSDGQMSPLEVKEYYLAHGYSVVAFTEHDIFITHNELTDDNFLALNGFEVEINEPNKEVWEETSTCHICFVALSETVENHPLWHRNQYVGLGNSLDYKGQVKFDESKPDYVRRYTPERISDMMRVGRENGFFVTYNHPRWSMETYERYSQYNGMHAMEIYNTGSVSMGFLDYNPQVYDEMLRLGKKIYCIAADDNHSTLDACGGHIMVKAEKLDYKHIADAIARGSFYSSTGPEIKELWYENGEVHIRCCDAKKILLSTGIRKQVLVSPEAGQSFVNEATFRINGNEKYFRITVLDREGNFAETNAYFIEDIM